MGTENEIVHHDKDKGLSVLQLWKDAFIQASRPKMKSVSVKVCVKGKDKGNVKAYIMFYLHIIVQNDVIETEA